MSPTEIAKLLAVIAAAYPSFEVDTFKHSVWLRFLGDLDYPTANQAVERHICASRFAPSIAEIREQAEAVLNPDAITGAEAWGEFIGGVKRFGWNREHEALESFHQETAQVARCIGWCDACMAENVDVLRGQFLRMFDQLKQRRKEEAIPQRRQIKGAR